MQIDFNALNQLARQMVITSLGNIGFFDSINNMISINSLQSQLNISSKYTKLFHALLDIINRAGLINIQNKNSVELTQPYILHSPNMKELQNQKILLSNKYPGFKAHIELAWTSFLSYPKVLTGQQNHMQALFPRGSFELIENVYLENEPAHHILTNLLVNEIREILSCHPKNTIKILELGAGTGGATSFILTAIHQFQNNIEYLFTDISNTFLKKAEDKFKPKYPFIQFSNIDIEKPPADLPVDLASVDLIIISHVLYSTGQIKRTLGHIKSLLKPTGKILICEWTRLEDFFTLCFGLTNGWWLFEDEKIRIPHSPLLEHEIWQQVLTESEFDPIDVVNINGMERLQSIFIAHNNQQSSITDSDQKKIKHKVLHSKKPKNIDNFEKKTKEHLKKILSQVLKIKITDLKNNEPFINFGLDSLIAMQVNEVLSLTYGPVPITLLLEYSTINKLTNYFLEYQCLQLQNTIAT